MTEEKIIEVMSSKGEPMKSAEIAEATGIDKKEVDKSIKKLVKEEKLFSPKRCFYAVK